MRFFVIGLGSMGKRRVRCLLSLGIKNDDIIGFDIREDRCLEAKNLYNINTINKFDEKIYKEVDAVIISTPPDKHVEYLFYSIEYKKPTFVEASVILKGLEEINNKAKLYNVLICPSCTLYFHPIIKDINRIVNSNLYGKVTNFSYHSGQYLPDWHPWEDINDFYVSKRETGGAREIVPFELTWITKIFGYPIDIKGYFKKTINLNCNIEDTYSVIIDFKDFLGNLVVDVVSRMAIRKLNLNFEKAYLYWDWDLAKIEIYEAENNRKIILEQPKGTAKEGYNKNIIEEMYIDEIKAFIHAIGNKGTFPNSLDEDISILKLLQKIEGGILP